MSIHEKKFFVTLDSLYDLLNFVKDEAKKKNSESAVIEKFLIAVEEAFTNIVNYSGLTKENEVIVECTLNDDCIQVTFKDKGKFYNPLADFQKLPNLKEPKIGGYGIYLMWQLTDKLEYKRVHDYNVLSLTKTFSKV
jgi:anti-sigma regulatory factor (Ser/Thr protein kinase)